MEAKKIDPSKPVQTRDGRPARILCTDRKDPKRPIVALYQSKEQPSQETAIACYLSGLIYEDHQSPIDLINIPRKITKTGFINIFSPENTQFHYNTIYPTREAAEQRNESGRVACVPITIECEEGDGL